MRRYHFILGCSRFLFEQKTFRIAHKSQLPWERTATELCLPLRGGDMLVVQRASTKEDVQGIIKPTFEISGYEPVSEEIINCLLQALGREISLWDFLQN